VVLLDQSRVASAVLILTSKVHFDTQFCSLSVYEGQTGLILKFGKYHRAVDPGLTKVNPYGLHQNSFNESG
jgi:hypothetical protein